MSNKSDCRHPSDGTCSCGATVAVDRVALWEEINRYVAICGGDPSKSIYGNTPRMEAVCRIENVISNRGVVTDEIGRWIRTDASDPLRGAIEADRRQSQLIARASAPRAWCGTCGSMVGISVDKDEP